MRFYITTALASLVGTAIANPGGCVNTDPGHCSLVIDRTPEPPDGGVDFSAIVYDNNCNAISPPTDPISHPSIFSALPYTVDVTIILGFGGLGYSFKYAGDGTWANNPVDSDWSTVDGTDPQIYRSTTSFNCS